MTYFIKNTSNDIVIEPHFEVRLEPGETRELEQNVAQRLLVIRPDAVKLVDGIEPAPEKEVKVTKTTKKSDKSEE